MLEEALRAERKKKEVNTDQYWWCIGWLRRTFGPLREIMRRWRVEKKELMSSDNYGV